MQDTADYQRGLQAARADARRGWVSYWLPAQELAEQAVYGGGLTVEQQGYAAGLEEAFPGGIPQPEIPHDRTGNGEGCATAVTRPAISEPYALPVAAMRMPTQPVSGRKAMRFMYLLGPLAAAYPARPALPRKQWGREYPGRPSA